MGCKLGQGCKFLHDRQLLKGANRCWNCSSDQHFKSDCPYVPSDNAPSPEPNQPGTPKDNAKAIGKGKDKGPKVGKAKPHAGGPKVAQVAENPASVPSEQPAPSASPTEELLREATEAIRAMKLKALRQTGLQSVSNEKLRLLDTGATASMRRGKDHFLGGWRSGTGRE